VRDLSKWLRLDFDDIQYTRELRKRAYGWVPKSMTDGSETATFPMLKLRFPTEKHMRIAAAILRKKKDYTVAGGSGKPIAFEIWESRVPIVHKFCDDQSIIPSGWVRIPAHAYRHTLRAAAHADVEVEVEDFTKVLSQPQITEMAPLLLASIDIECYSATHEFPQAGTDPICGIGTSLKRLGREEIERHYFALKETRLADDSKMKGVLQIHWHENQYDLLHAWRDWFIQVNPDVVTGYNTNIFDFKYMADTVTSVTRGKHTRWFFLSRLWAEHTPLEAPEFSSNAYGERSFHTFSLAGRLVLDLLEVIRREHKLRSYTLGNVAKTFLPCLVCGGDKKKNKEKVAQCLECKGSGGMSKLDLPPQEIFKKFEGTAEDRGCIAEYCSMDCDLVLELMSKLCTLQNIVEMSKVTLTPVQDIVSKGQQAKVFNQIVWYGHRDGFVINDACDVQLDKDGYEGARVLDPHPGYYKEPIATLDFASLYPSIMMQHNLCFSTWVNNENYLNIKGAVYKSHNVGPRTYWFVTHIMGILPKILKTLLAARKAVRKEMEAEKDPFRKSLLNAKQLAIKVSCNSVYGFCGTGKKGKYPCLAVSDATTYNGRIMITTLKKTIEDKYPGTEVIYGDSVTGETPVLVQNPQGKINIIPIQDLAPQDGTEMSTRHKNYLNLPPGWRVWTEKGWTQIVRVMRHRVNKKLYRVTTPKGSVTVTEDHSLILRDGNVVTPARANLGIDLLHSFPDTAASHEEPEWLASFQEQLTATKDSFAQDGLFCGDPLTAARFYYAAKRLGWDVMVVVDPEEMGDHTYSLRPFSAAPDRAFSVYCYEETTPSEGALVYDLTTENHHFQAGVGEIIVHNTDSVMVKFPLRDHPSPIEESFRLGNEVCVLAHEMFGENISLTMEKVFSGYILLKKKRYAGLSYEDPKKPPKLKMSGIEAVRRDVALMVCKTQEEAVNALLIDKSVQKAVQIIRDKLSQLEKNEVPFDEYMLSFQLKKEYKNPNQAQQVLVNTIKEREPGSEPKSGDRVQYVIKQIAEKNAPLYKKVEEAKFARDHAIALDRLYYLENQMERPLSDLMEAFVPNPKEIFDETRIKLQNQRDRNQDIHRFYKRLTPAKPASEEPVTAPSEKPLVQDLVGSRRKRVGLKEFDPRQPKLSFSKKI